MYIIISLAVILEPVQLQAAHMAVPDLEPFWDYLLPKVHAFHVMPRNLNPLNMSLVEINKRYSDLATSDCCLSCGGALDYSEPQKGEICLDLGSGRGTDVLRLAEAVGPDGFVYGVDISEGMIEKSVSTAQRLGITNVKFLKNELDAIDIPFGTIDLVISNCTINHASDKQAVWNEVFRVLKKGGRFVISDIYANETVPEEFRNDPIAIAECWAGAVTKEEYLRQLEIAGLTAVKLLEESAPYEKGKIKVSSITITGNKPAGCCCCTS
jgi:arsenite methyltransferase